jgi:hypothetical protein
VKKRCLLLSAVLLLSAAAALAEQDFYGIQMKNDRWAKKLVWKTGPEANQADLLEGPILSHDVTAEASLKEIPDGLIDFRVTVFNATKSPISTEFDFRDFYITTRNGRQYPLIDRQDRPELDAIEAKSNVTFNPSLGNLKIQNKDVVLIECSFDLGKTKVFLFPWSEKNAVMKLSNPPRPVLPAKNTQKEKGKTPKRDLWGWLSGQDRHKRTQVISRPPSKTFVVSQKTAKSAPAKIQTKTPVEVAPQSKKRQLEEAIKKFVYVPADAARPAVKTPAKSPNQTFTPRTEAHVVGFNKEYRFVTLDAGSRDGLQDNMVLNILRNGKTIAKVRVERLREAVSAAMLVPESRLVEIKSGDQISFV